MMMKKETAWEEEDSEGEGEEGLAQGEVGVGFQTGMMVMTVGTETGKEEEEEEEKMGVRLTTTVNNYTQMYMCMSCRVLRGCLETQHNVFCSQAEQFLD